MADRRIDQFNVATTPAGTNLLAGYQTDSVKFTLNQLGLINPFGAFATNEAYTFDFTFTFMDIIPTDAGVSINFPDLSTVDFPEGQPFYIANAGNYPLIISPNTLNPGELYIGRIIQKATSPQIIAYIQPKNSRFEFLQADYGSDASLGFITEKTFLIPSGANLKVILPDMTQENYALNRDIIFSNVGNYVTTIVAKDTTTVIATLRPTESVYLTLLSKDTQNGTFAVTQQYQPISSQGVDIFPCLFPSITNGATINQREAPTWGNNQRVLTFSSAGANFAVGSFIIPQKFSNTNFGARFVWRTASTLTDSVQWYIQAVIRNPNDPFDITYGSAVSAVSAATGTAQQTIFTDPTLAIVPQGSGTGDRQIEFRIFRIPGAGFDNLAADVDLCGVEVFFNLIAANDVGLG